MTHDLVCMCVDSNSYCFLCRLHGSFLGAVKHGALTLSKMTFFGVEREGTYVDDVVR